MRILFVSRCLPLPRHYGDRLILFHLLRGLRAHGHHCSVVALAQPSDDETVRAAGAALADVLEVVPERRRSPLAYLARAVAPFPDRASRTWHPEMWNAVARLAGGSGCDVVHFLGGVPVYEHRDAAPALPRVIQPYESYTWWLTRAIGEAETPVARWSLRLKRRIARRFERQIYVGFDRVLLNAGPDERCLKSLAPELRTAVIPQGVDVPEAIVPVAQRPGSNMVFVGNFSYGPNVHAALRLVNEILPRVRERVPGATVSLVGADPSPSLRRLAGAGVEVTGTVPDVLPWLTRARVFVSPLTTGAGMKNKVLEAMASGTPVVATPLSCDGIDLSPGEHALVARSSEDLAEAACRVLTQDKLGGDLSRSASRLVEARYRWTTVIGRYEALYAELAAAGTGAPT